MTSFPATSSTQKPLFWSLTPLGPALYDLVEKDALSLKLLIEFLVFVEQGWQPPCCLCLGNLGLLANLSGYSVSPIGKAWSLFGGHVPV